MDKQQLTTWACGHNQLPYGASPSDNPCPKCKTQGVSVQVYSSQLRRADYYRPGQGLRRADYYRPGQGLRRADYYRPGQGLRRADYYRPEQKHRRADYYRPVDGRRRQEKFRGGSGVRNARGKNYYDQTRRLGDDWRKREKIDIRRSQREQEQYEEVRAKRRELAREQDQYEEERERQQDEEYCPCDKCWDERREKLNYKIHKWLATTEELNVIIWIACQREYRLAANEFAANEFR